MSEYQERTHAITPAHNRELVIFGVPRVFFLCSAGISVVVFLFTWSFVIGLVLQLVLCLLSYWSSADDVSFPAILASGLRMTPIYDPLVRKESLVEFVER
jgi:type IV secretory pathway VirB3-like protein